MEGYQLAANMNFKFQQCNPTPLDSIVTNISQDGLKLMSASLLWNPEKRPSAAAVSSVKKKFIYSNLNLKLFFFIIIFSH